MGIYPNDGLLDEGVAGQELISSHQHEYQNKSDEVTLLSLPNEILENICYHLDIHSLCAVSQACRRLSNVQESDRVWRAAFYKRFVPPGFGNGTKMLTDLNAGLYLTFLQMELVIMHFQSPSFHKSII